jgi:aryl-alcohol dehydrogenase-like predicted oxidoreductase
MSASTLPYSLKQSLEATKVNYAQLGTSGLRVSVPILGTMSIGHKDWKPWVLDDKEQVECILKAAFDRGLNTWDTANVYSNGISEKMIGQAILKFQIPRHKLVLLTKLCGYVGEEPNVAGFPEMKSSKDYVNQGGLSRAAIFNAVEASLERLQTTYIDLLQIHVIRR